MSAATSYCASAPATLTAIPREDRAPLPSRDSARARHQALEYLASALEAPSLREDPRVAGIVRGSTDHGKTVVSFLLHVMHGVVRGFRPRQRVDAASELLGHIARDELARSGSVTPSPAPAADESSFPSSREPIPGPSSAKADPTAIPAEAGIQQGGDGDDADYPRTAAAPESSSRKANRPFPRRREPIPGPAKADPTVIPAEAGIQQGGDGDDPDDTDTQRGCYDIDRKITEAQRTPPTRSQVRPGIRRGRRNLPPRRPGERQRRRGPLLDLRRGRRRIRQVHLGVRPGIPQVDQEKTPPQAPPLPRTRDRAQGRERLDEASLRQDARGRHPAAQTHPDVDLTPAPPPPPLPRRERAGVRVIPTRPGRGQQPMGT